MVGVDLDIPSLIKEPALLIIIPVLIGAFLISKLLPVLFIRRWFDTKTTIASAIFTHFNIVISYCGGEDSRTAKKRYRQRHLVF